MGRPGGQRLDRRLRLLLLVLLLAPLALVPRSPAPSRRGEEQGEQVLASLRRARSSFRSLDRESRDSQLAGLLREHHRHLESMDDEARRAETAFRAGQLLAQVGSASRARDMYRRAEQLDPRGPFAVRSILERAHLARRHGELFLAMDRYQQVVGDPRARSDLRQQAWCGLARVQETLGEWASAAITWSRIAEGAGRTSLRALARSRSRVAEEQLAAGH